MTAVFPFPLQRNDVVIPSLHMPALAVPSACALTNSYHRLECISEVLRTAGAGLLNHYTGLNPHRGFESPLSASVSNQALTIKTDLPLLIRNGFKGPVYCTAATKDLCAIPLPDSGYLQERDAEYANRHGFSKHKPALPLYTEAEAVASLKRFVPKKFDEPFDVWSDFKVCFRPAGHILGAAFVELTVGSTTLVFSGDLGRPGSRTMVDPAPLRKMDYLVVESTYGDRTHDPADPEDRLAELIRKTTGRGGVVLIPTFAVGRAQSLLYHLHRLKVFEAG